MPIRVPREGAIYASLWKGTSVALDEERAGRADNGGMLHPFMAYAPGLCAALWLTLPTLLCVCYTGS